MKLCCHGGGEADFGDQQNGRAAGEPCVFHSGQIHRGLARAGHSMQQASAKTLSIERGLNMRQRCLLGLVEDIVCSRSCGTRKVKGRGPLFDRHPVPFAIDQL